MEKTINQEVKISAEIQKAYDLLLTQQNVREALQFIELDNDATTQDQIEVTAIPAPSFAEHERGQFYKKRLEDLGLQEIQEDEEGNVFGVLRGTGNGPKLIVSAHLDTVFPAGTDTIAKIVDGKVYAPGISDDGRGLASLLSLLRTLKTSNIQTVGDIVIVATVGEEGLGDLRGVKTLFKNHTDIDGFISIEPGSPERTTYLATGSHRYSVTFNGPGGHSFGSFGLPSAIHALGRAVSKISDLETPSEPKTTFTVGTITGGTSVNTIAEDANMVIDLRSTSQEELLKLEERVLEMIHESVEEENRRWKTDSISVDIQLVGDRPAGSQSADAVIVQSTLAAAKTLGFEPILDVPSSTDSNVPISLGIPAVTLGGGGNFGGCHTLNEYFDPKDAFYGIQKIFLTMLGLVGVVNVCEPILQRKAK